MKKAPLDRIEGGRERSGRDSNPQVLSDARFRGECISHSATAPRMAASHHSIGAPGWTSLRSVVSANTLSFPLRGSHRLGASARTVCSNPGAKADGRFASSNRGARIDLASLGRLGEHPLVPLRGSHRLGASARTVCSNPGAKADGRFASSNRGARIRTGDLCDPNAALYRTEPRPGKLTGYPLCSDGRGGIRTHAGVSPHDFQSCALSHSATRPRSNAHLGSFRGN